MPILLGVLASIGIGVSDYLARFASRRTQATTTVATALIGGTVMALVLLPIVPSSFTARDFGLGAASGSLIGTALTLMYRGMSLSSTAVVSPVVAVFMSLFPVGYDLSTGQDLSALVATGIGVAIAGVVVITAGPVTTGRVLPGLAFGSASGICFGIALTMVGRTDIDSGMWSAVGQRSVALAFMMALATASRVPRVLPPHLVRGGLLSGVLGSAGVAAYIAGTQRGSLSQVAVASSMFPAVTAVLAAWFDEDTLHWWQLVGIAGVLAGVSLIAVG